MGPSGRRLVHWGKCPSRGLWDLSPFLFLLLFPSHYKVSSLLHHLLPAMMSGLATDLKAIEQNRRPINPFSLYVFPPRDGRLANTWCSGVGLCLISLPVRTPVNLEFGLTLTTSLLLSGLYKDPIFQSGYILRY